MEKHDMELANKLNSDLSMAIEASTAMASKIKNGNLKNYLYSHVEKYEDLQDNQKLVYLLNSRHKEKHYDTARNCRRDHSSRAPDMVPYQHSAWICYDTSLHLRSGTYRLYGSLCRVSDNR